MLALIWILGIIAFIMLLGAIGEKDNEWRRNYFFGCLLILVMLTAVVLKFNSN
jgi:hypothetical protein